MEAKPRKVVALKIKPQRNGIADYGSDEIESSNGMRLSPGRKRSSRDATRPRQHVRFKEQVFLINEDRYLDTKFEATDDSPRYDQDDVADTPDALVFERSPLSGLDRAAFAARAANIPIEFAANAEVDDDTDAEQLLSQSPEEEDFGEDGSSSDDERFKKSEASEGSEDADNEERPEDCAKLSRPEDFQLRYRHTLKTEGISATVALALHEELQGYATLHGEEVKVLKSVAYTIGIATHPKILCSILKSSLRKDYKSDRELRSTLDALRLHQRDQTRPAIYCQQLADSNGDLPSANRLHKAVKLARVYVDGSNIKYIARIDRMGRTSRTKQRTIPPHYPKYMLSEDESGGLRLSQTRIKSTSAFLDALEERCLNVPPDQYNKPLPGWLSEFGYTHTTEKRFINHMNHRSSNYIMNLFSRILELEWPQQYSLHQFVVFVCTTANQASVAEILFTRLGVAFTGNGGGFTHYPPGLSNDSAQWYDTTAWEGWWEWTSKRMKVQENHERQKTMWEQQLHMEKRDMGRFHDVLDRRSELDASIARREATFSPEIAKYMRQLTEGKSIDELKGIRDQIKSKSERMYGGLGGTFHSDGDLIQRAAKAIRVMRAAQDICAKIEALRGEEGRQIQEDF